MRSFEIKVYDLTLTLIKTIPSSVRKNNITFSQNINWPQGQANIELNYKINEELWFTEWNVIRVFAYDETFKAWKLIYSWTIEIITQDFGESIQTVVLECQWLWQLLNKVLFEDGTLSFIKNDDPANIIKEIIDDFGWYYPNFLSYTTESIDDYWSNINIEFENQDSFNSIKRIVEITDYWWFVDAEWIVYFKPKPTTNTHEFTLQDDVQSLTIWNDIWDLVNNVFVVYAAWIVWPIEDLTSRNTYWLRQTVENRNDILDSSTATEFANNFIADNKDKKLETTLVINTRYDTWSLTFEDIKPWDTIKVKNTTENIDIVQIAKVDYTPEFVTINLEDFLSFGKEIVNL